MNVGFSSDSEGARTLRTARKSSAAFTMVEIALCLAIIGFAVVAIIGVLPTGLDVQRINREETVINQDAAVWFDALRNGADGYDDLTNYVVAITNTVAAYSIAGNVTNLDYVDTHVFTRTASFLNGTPVTPPFRLTNAAHILGLLGTPKIVWGTNSQTFFSNSVVAAVRSMSGAMLEKAPQPSEEMLETAFTYRLIPEVVPYVPFDPETVNFVSGSPGYGQKQERSTMVLNLMTNTYDIRLRFRWPLYPMGKVGNEAQTFRLLVSGQLTNKPSSSLAPVRPKLYFILPSTYAKGTLPP